MHPLKSAASANDAGATTVAIGVPAGADRIPVRQGLIPLIEADCQQPLLMSVDIQLGRLTWSEDFLIYPSQAVDDGSRCIAALRPGLVDYFERKIEICPFSALMRRGSIRCHAQALCKLQLREASSLTTKVK